MSEEIVIYVYSTPSEMRECFRTYENLFDKYSKINCYGILKNGVKLQFTNNPRGLRNVKTYDEIHIRLQEMQTTYLQQENQQLKSVLNEVRYFIGEPASDFSYDDIKHILELLDKVGDQND